ncbi:MAG: hypothetical protein J2P38_02025 [Candidatus Dormibacteraeota bacterium]|nr:hypothetical protein [Candidatus Dormibacteraeota bacterium]
MHDDERRQESDFGQEQLRRVAEEGQEFQPDAPEPTPALDSEEAAQRIEVVDDPDQGTAVPPEPLDPDLQEDLRRAQPNPPLTESAQADPMSDVDLGYMEDQERETDWDLDSQERPVAARPSDPLEAEREQRARPGQSTEQLPDEVGNRPPGERGGREGR